MKLIFVIVFFALCFSNSAGLSGEKEAGEGKDLTSMLTRVTGLNKEKIVELTKAFEEAMTKVALEPSEKRWALHLLSTYAKLLIDFEDFQDQLIRFYNAVKNSKFLFWPYKLC